MFLKKTRFASLYSFSFDVFTIAPIYESADRATNGASQQVGSVCARYPRLVFGNVVPTLINIRLERPMGMMVIMRITVSKPTSRHTIPYTQSKPGGSCGC